METFIVYAIVFLSVINILRMASFMIASDWYWLHIRNKKKEKWSRKKSFTPFVSVIIAAYNEEKSIKRTLRSVAASRYPAFEIIVVNDGSADATVEKIKEFKKSRPKIRVTVLSQVNQGKAHALNYGIRQAARGQLIMTLDADSRIDPYGIRNSVAYFRNPKIKAVASNVRILKSYTLLGLIQYIEYLFGYHLKKSYTVFSMEYIIGGIGSMFRKSTLREVGWYDTDTVTEDIDVTMKIIGRGNIRNQVIYGDDVITYTQPVESFTDLFKQRYRWKYGRFQTMFKNRHLLFLDSPGFTKLLTHIQLPFVLYSEFTFLLDPVLVGFIIYLSFLYRDALSVQWILLFYCFYTFMIVLSDARSSGAEKIKLLAVAPLSYIFFAAISVIEYVALWKCIAGFDGILRAREINECSWDHVSRASI